MFWVSIDVVEVLTLTVGGTRHATADDARCVRHSRRRRRVSRRNVMTLLGAQRRSVRLSSLDLHRLLTLSVQSPSALAMELTCHAIASVSPFVTALSSKSADR